MNLSPIPSSVYHLHIHADFPIKKVLEILPYLDALGIEGIYASPIFEAASVNGYDIVNPNIIDPRIGTYAEFETLCEALKARNLKLVLDIIPNHMGIKGKKNLWWQDVLENGPHSPFADFFDINWNPPNPQIKNKLLLPILADSYGSSLLNQQIQLKWEDHDFWICYDGYPLPLTPTSYPFVLEAGLPLTPEWREDERECLEISRLFREGHKINRERKQRLKDLYDRSVGIREYLTRIVALFNGKSGEYATFNLLHELLEQQFYRLAHWLVAGQEINYHRFFNINELAAIRIENERVMNEHHHFLFDLIKREKVQGVRIDHPDGLYDPELYFDRLQKHNPPFVVIEKILDSQEILPASWNVQGTVGYEFLNVLQGLFIRQKNESFFSKIYDSFIGHGTDFDHLLYERKKWYIKMHMASEIRALGWQLKQLVATNWYYRDFTQADLNTALEAIMASLPVYRTYMRGEEPISNRDKTSLLRTIELAQVKTPEIDPSIYTYLRDLFLGELKQMLPIGAHLVLRFQQQTAPVMAKGQEDSCFYIFNRFVALNEVGGNPRHFGTSKAEFHQFNSEKLTHWPLGFLPMSTHDTKWSGDARMRLSVLSEIPKKWKETVVKWERENQKYKTTLQGMRFPDPNTEYYLYQMLLAVWPDDTNPSELHTVHERLWSCLLKSMREAGIHTSWRHPNEAYEKAAHLFLTSILTPHEENPFYLSFIDFQKEIAAHGRLNSLSAWVLRAGSCGIVDLYQGDEGWNDSLMDPDNRRPVNFDQLESALKTDENLKLWVTARALQTRRKYKELFLTGEYLPVTVQKEGREHIVVFMRKGIHSCALIAAGRFFTQLPALLGNEGWGDTTLVLPKKIKIKELFDIFTEKSIPLPSKGENTTLLASDLFQKFPFSICMATTL